MHPPTHAYRAAKAPPKIAATQEELNHSSCRFAPSIDTKVLGDIADALDELLLPYTIDLSVYETLRNDTLREHIDRVGKLFYEKDATFH
ncbi:MAG: hypothetical protein GX639_04445 [Fibrobacter sp.]|nr:hypothetical protein [Fibrobacter sp.]